MAQLKASRLTSFEIARAKYGRIDLPLRLEAAISDLRSEIDGLENQAHQLRQSRSRRALKSSTPVRQLVARRVD
jgi:hypothetical protein